MRRFELHEKKGNPVPIALGVEWSPGGQRTVNWAEGAGALVYGDLAAVTKRHIYDVFWLDAGGERDVRDQRMCPICLRCTGGPYMDRSHHCIDCGALNNIVFLPIWAVQDIRRKDKQRIDSLKLAYRELELLRGALPIPEFVTVKKAVAGEHLNAQDAAGYTDLWWVQAGTTTTSVKAPTEAEALAAGARAVSWLHFLENMNGKA